MSTSRTDLSRFTAIFAGGTLVSRIFGLVRDIMMGALIPGPAREVFLFAFRFPNMLRDMLGEGAVNAAFIPVMTEAQEREGDEAFKQLVRACLGTMLLVFTGVTLVGLVLAGYIPEIVGFAARFSSEASLPEAKIALTVATVRWSLPYFIFVGLMAYLMAPLYVMRHYSTPAWAPALLNVSLIGCMCWGAWWATDSTWVLVAGIWIGGIAQSLVMYYAVVRRMGPLWPSLKVFHPGVRRAFWLLGPVIFGQATGEVNKVVDAFFAHSLGEVSTLFYANRLVQLPLSIFAMAIGLAILPAINRAYVKSDEVAMRQTLTTGFRQCVFLVAPAMAGLLALRDPLVSLLFERGEFTADDSAKTATALLYYGAGLLIFALIRVGVQGFYAVQNTRTPVVLASVSMLANIGLNFALVGPMGYRGLALATTLSYCLNFLLLYVFLCRRFGALWDKALAKTVLITFSASLVMAGLAAGMYTVFAHLLDTTKFPQEAAAVLLPVAAAVAIYMAFCEAFKLPEWLHFKHVLLRR